MLKYDILRNYAFIKIVMMAFSSVMFVVILYWINCSRVPYLQRQKEALYVHQWRPLLPVGTA